MSYRRRGWLRPLPLSPSSSGLVLPYRVVCGSAVSEKKKKELLLGGGYPIVVTLIVVARSSGTAPRTLPGGCDSLNLALSGILDLDGFRARTKQVVVAQLDFDTDTD